MFNALLVEKDDAGVTRATVQELGDDRLPAGEVTVAVEYSTLNYKDGLCIGPGGGLVRTYPHVPGIDFAGKVLASDDARYRAGDRVVLTGWRVGEAHWGGYATRARVKADWLVPLPAGISTKQAMAVGVERWRGSTNGIARSQTCPRPVRRPSAGAYRWRSRGQQQLRHYYRVTQHDRTRCRCDG